MKYELFVTPGLGDNSYLLVSGDEAAVIDPQRDAWRFLAVAEAQKIRVRYVLETHVHNDYVSGALEIRAAAGAEIAAPARGRYEFPTRAVAEGDELHLGGLRIVAWETPGHTPEHLAWLVSEADHPDPVAVFSGGSLIVGSAGRTDLLGAEFTDPLTRAQFRSLRRLAGLPRAVRLLPTHGAGSFCTASVLCLPFNPSWYSEDHVRRFVNVVGPWLRGTSPVEPQTQGGGRRGPAWAGRPASSAWRAHPGPELTPPAGCRDDEGCRPGASRRPCPDRGAPRVWAPGRPCRGNGVFGHCGSRRGRRAAGDTGGARGGRRRDRGTRGAGCR